MLFAIFLTGCSALGSKEAVIGCSGADVASTEYALHHNPNAYETNPGGRPFAYGLHIVVIGAVAATPSKDWEATWLPARVFLALLGCGAALNNLHVARQKP